MAEKVMRPPPDELRLLTKVLPLFAVMSSMSGTFVQVAFSQNLLVSTVVAIVGNAIAPGLLKLIRHVCGSVASRVAMLASILAMLGGLAAALFLESLLVMIWGFTSSNAAVNLTMQYVEDLMTEKGASKEEKEAWKLKPFLITICGALAGFLLGPCLYNSLWQSQAYGLALMLLPIPLLLRLPDVPNTYTTPAKWSFQDLKSPKVQMCLACLLLQVSRNLCRETLLGPSITARNYTYGYDMDYWSWGQLNFLATLGGVVGFISSMGVQGASRSFAVAMMVLCALVLLVELNCVGFRQLMVSNFSAALLHHFSAPLIWRLFQDVVSSEEMAVLQQAVGFFELILGCSVPILCGAAGIYGYGTTLLTLLSALLLLMVLSLPKGKAD